MNTLIHLSHQSIFMLQEMMAALVMLGLGLEGLSTDQEFPNSIKETLIKPVRPEPVEG